MTYSERYEIKPLTKPPIARVRVPGSKSITNRGLILAALSEPGKGSKLRGVLRSEDTEIMVQALGALGFQVQADWDNEIIEVRRGPGQCPISAAQADLFLGNSGTSMRFL